MALTEIKTKGIADDAVTTDKLNLTNDGNNRVITGDGSGGLNGEANLTFDGSKLLLGTTTEGHTPADNLTIEDSGNCGITLRSGTTDSGIIYFSDGTSGAAEYEGFIQYSHGSTNVMYLGAGQGTRMEISHDGNVKINDGDLIIGTSGHAIDFSAAETGTATSGEQKLDAYEQGTWTITYPNGTITAAHSIGKYIKVGNLCTAWMGFEIGSASSDTHPAFSLPFAQKLTGTNSDARATGSIMMHKVDWQSDQKQATPYIGAEASAVSIFMLRDNLGWQQLENDEISANDWFYITITYQTA